MVGKSLRNRIGYAQRSNIISKLVRTRGNLERVTVMCVENAAGEKFKHDRVFPSKQTHYQKFKGTIEIVQSYLPAYYFSQRTSGVVDSSIFFDWAKNFVAETANLRRTGQNMLFCLMAMTAISSTVFSSFSRTTACMSSKSQPIRRMC